MYSEQDLIDYRRVEKAIQYIAENKFRQPDLDEVASHVHLSPFHFQKLFRKWAGVTPKKFLQYLTIEHARGKLDENINLADVAQDSGLSGSSRLHDLFVSIEGMTPDQYRKKGKDLTIYYEFYFSQFGKYLLAVTEEGRICSLLFSDNEEDSISVLNAQWVKSNLTRSRDKTRSHAAELFNSNPGSILLLLKGTNFQLKVWEALLKIPQGKLVSYQAIAQYLNKPGALQAVGSSIGKNPIAFLIPCHRVIRKAGNISEYRWGRTRKLSLIGWEAAQVNS